MPSEQCPCIYPDIDPDQEENPDRLCACGHVPDEHDVTGQCQAEVQ